jgi:predicted nucleic acid-binding protein
MPRSLVDTSVLFAAAYRRDENHSSGYRIVSGIDSGELPETVILDYVLAETLNGLTQTVGHSGAVEFLDRIESNVRFSVGSLRDAEFAVAKDEFRRHDGFSFVDSAVSVYARSRGIRYLYAFDDDFDRIGALSRLNDHVDPYEPN